MKKLVKAIILLVLVSISFQGEAVALAPTPKRAAAKQRKTKARNYALTVDSIHWLIERHCDNKIESMGKDDGTIEQIKLKYNSLPQTIADSLIVAQYAKIVTLFEEERNNRAFALTDCYYAIAKDDDPNLGPLYLNDIVLAIERNDSILLRTRMNELNTYALRNNLDYDQDLEEAEQNMALLRRRVAFNEKKFTDYVKPGELWVLDVRRPGGAKYYAYDEFVPFLPIYLAMANAGKRNGQLVGVQIENVINGDKENKTLYLSPMFNWSYDNVVKDDEGKHYFASYSTEKGGTTNPEMLASGRMLVQNLHATVTGELARKKYSAGAKIGGEVAATIVDAGLNALFNYLSVTTQYAYSTQLNLTLTQPDLMEGELNIVRAKVRSDNPDNPDIRHQIIPIRYYRTYTLEDLHLINHKSEPVYGLKMNRENYEKEKKKYKLKERHWKKEQAQWKKANKGAKPQYKKYYEFHNDSVMYLLRQRAETSLENIEL